MEDVVMKKLKLVLLFAAVIGCTGSACPKKIKTTSLIVHGNYFAGVATSEGGIVQWVSDPTNPRTFAIHIYGPNPCVGGANNIVGNPAVPAVCHLASGTDGTYQYAALPPSVSPTAPGVTKLYFYTDSCRLCQIVIQKQKQAKHPPVPTPIAPSNPPVVPISCDDNGDAVADPTEVQAYSKQLILWTQVGKDATTDWSATFS